MARISQYPHGQPRDPHQIFQIIKLRKDKSLTWRDIGKIMGMTHQGPYLLYKRWKAWSKKAKNRKAYAND